MLIKIDDKEFEINKGETILECAKRQGIDIPHYCYHPAMKIVGSCRMCMVEMEGMPKLMTSCSTTVMELKPEKKFEGKYDALIRTENDRVKKARESVLEFLLINHPLDCPVCDQAGECFLQDYSFKYGSGTSRFDEQKRVLPYKDLGGDVYLYTTRCILCTRCVRFTEEISGTNEITVQARGYHTEITTFPGEKIDPQVNKISSNVIDICPVGALVSKDFLFKPRIWNYQKSDTICTRCSTGCNITTEVKENKIYRIKPRENMQVNQWWMCDEGRYGYHDWEKAERISHPSKHVANGSWEPIAWEDAFDLVVKNISENKSGFGALASTYLSNEELYLLKELVGKTSGEAGNCGYRKGATGESWKSKSGFTIQADKSPNTFGAEKIIGTTSESILTRIREGKITSLLVFGGSIHQEVTHQEKEAFSKLKFLAVVDVANGPLADQGQLILPGSNGFEKTGSFTNVQGMVQRTRQVIHPPGSAQAEWKTIKKIGEKLGLKFDVYSTKEIFEKIGNQIPSFKDMTYEKMGRQGQKVND